MICTDIFTPLFKSIPLLNILFQSEELLIQRKMVARSI